MMKPEKYALEKITHSLAATALSLGMLSVAQEAPEVASPEPEQMSVSMVANSVTGEVATTVPEDAEKKFIHSLKRKIIAGKKVAVGIHDKVLWRDDADADRERVTSVPLSGDIRTKQGQVFTVFFNVKQQKHSLSSLKITPIPEDAQFYDIRSGSNGVEQTSTLLPTRFARLSLNKHDQPVINHHSEHNHSEKIKVGTQRAPTYDELVPYQGERFADISAISQLEQAGSFDAATAAVQSFLDQYDISLHIGSADIGQPLYAYYDALTPANLGELKQYGEMFINEWAKYPPAYIAKLRLRSVNFTNNLALDSAHTQQVGGLADTDSQTVYFNLLGRIDPLRRAIHHELGHFLQASIEGMAKDQAWLTYNPPGFTYKGNGLACNEGSCPGDEHPLASFVSGYAESAEIEDQAEVIGHLLSPVDYPKLTSWEQTDPLLAEKVDYIKNDIANLSSTMTGDYFSRVNPGS